MASHSEIALNTSAESTSTSKSRKARTRRTGAKSAKKQQPKAAARKEKEAPVGTDVVPVMKLRAIDIVDNGALKPGSNANGNDKDVIEEKAEKAIPMPAPAFSQLQGPAQQNGLGHVNNEGSEQQAVTDPELLELLEQLSATIDTAHSVLDAAGTSAEEEGELQAQATALNGGQKPVSDTDPDSDPDPDDLPPIAAGQSQGFSPQADAVKKDRVGLGLLANTALTGLVFAAGIAWLLHTNPWLINSAGESEKTPEPVRQEQAAPVKDQTNLPNRTPEAEQTAAIPAQDPAAFSPPQDDPTPMELLQSATPKQAGEASVPVQGIAGEPIALDLDVSGKPEGSEISVMVQGVPENAKLSTGKSLGAGNWLLSEQDTTRLALVTDKTIKPGTYDLEFILVSGDGSVPVKHTIPVLIEAGSSKAAGASDQTSRMEASAAGRMPTADLTSYAKPGVAVSVATPQPAIPAPNAESTEPSPLSPQEFKVLLGRADTLLQEGDVSGARLLLEYAAERGNKQAMMKLAESYDPKYLAKLGVRGVQPNEKLALQWYQRATGGQPTQ